MSGFVEGDDENLVLRARDKCHRGEIDAELRDMIALMVKKGMSPILCDGNGNKVIPGGPVPSAFTLRVGTLSCIAP